MTGIRRALAFSVGERYVMLVIAMGSSMIIARLLTPEVIGIFSVTMAFIGIAQVLRDFGVASYLIQERELTEEHIRTAFGVSLVLGSVVFAILFVAAPYIGRVYSEPAMVTTLRVCSLNFLFLPVCTVSLALLRREMAFQRLAAVNLVATLAGAVVSVGLALAGVGVVSLAIGSVITNLVTGVGAWLASSQRQLLLPAFGQWRKVLSFGAQSSLSGVVTSVSMDINDLAVGKILGFEPVAVLSRAQGLMSIFHRDLMSAIRNVAYPAYALASREGRPMEPPYVASVTHVTAIGWPFYAFVSMFAHEVLRLLYGPQWDAAAPLVPVFCLAGAVAAIANLASSQILAVGRVDLLTKLELAFQPLRAVLIVVVALTFKTMLACAVALVVAYVIQLPMIYYAKGRCVTNDYRGLARGLRQSASVTIASMVLPALLAWTAAEHRGDALGWVAFGAAVALCPLSWVLALVWLRHPLADDPVFHRLVGSWVPGANSAAGG